MKLDEGYEHTQKCFTNMWASIRTTNFTKLGYCWIVKKTSSYMSLYPELQINLPFKKNQYLYEYWNENYFYSPEIQTFKIRSFKKTSRHEIWNWFLFPLRINGQTCLEMFNRIKGPSITLTFLLTVQRKSKDGKINVQ